ncbi:hypothetical protein DVW31_07735 [Enterococcus faecium]|nr:hypothetical protein DVV90_07775 [Enterococcus faecium]TKL36378.1 hypothetical protein DVW10_07340 [Enterococcus faecium]TKL40777.1 hypothetical protein DVV96_07645 [Enterococcus faecium]TKL42892.1 hypothetical protein DVV92_07690 [Enterococcus faecium]TKL44469.1 hypothetical protein DVW09_07645 [Enterococcus faecium]
MADLSALDEDREIRFVSPESSIGIAKIQKLIARSIFSSGMKRNGSLSIRTDGLYKIKSGSE